MKEVRNRLIAIFSIVFVFSLLFSEGIAAGNKGQKTTCYVMNAKKKITVQLYYFDGVTDIPYVSMKDAAKLIQIAFQIIDKKSKVELTMKEDGTAVFSRENGAAVSLNFEDNKIIFNSFDLFFAESEDANALDIVTNIGSGSNKMLQTNSISYRSGKSYTLQLDDYHIYLIKEKNAGYIPLQTLSDVMISASGIILMWNGKSVYMVSDLSSEDLKKLYYAEGPKGDRSPELIKFTYNEFCLAMDLHYGLQSEHDIEYFSDYFDITHLTAGLKSTNSVISSNTLEELCSVYLADGHSNFLEYSPLSASRSKLPGSGWRNKYGIQTIRKAYLNARKKVYPNVMPGYEEFGDTAYIAFDRFNCDFSRNYYKINPTNTAEDTIELILYANQMIRRKDSPIRNVVIDLSCNSGGYLSVAVCIASWVLGDCTLHLSSAVDGAESVTRYQFDANRDNQYRKEDDSIADLELYCLISPVSFSCGNLLPALLKSSEDVMILGRVSRGGGCTTQKLSLADGSLIQISSRIRMNTDINGTEYNVDTGVEPDLVLVKPEDFFDRVKLTKIIQEAL